jgi:hypothetical protein
MDKKFSYLACCILLLIFSFSYLHGQFNRFGGGLTFNTPVSNSDLTIGNPGIHLRGVMELGDKFFVIPSITFQIPKTKTYSSPYSEKMTFLGSLDADLTYKLETEKQLLFYALAGANFTNIYESWNTEVPDVENEYEFQPGLGIGTGIEMIVEQNINAYAQVKYIIGKYQQLIIFIGVHYYFKGRKYRAW